MLEERKKDGYDNARLERFTETDEEYYNKLSTIYPTRMTTSEGAATH